MLRLDLAPRQLRNLLKLSAMAAFVGLVIGLAPVGPGQARAADDAHLTISGNSFGQSRDFELNINKSLIVDLPVDAKEVIVSQPGIVNAILRSKRRIILQGTGVGETNVIMLDAAGRTISVLDIEVGQEKSPIAAALETTLARVLPNSNIRVETVSDKAVDGKTFFMLTGTVQTAEEKTIAEQIATDLSEDGKTAGSLIQVVGAQQVMLKVTVAEVSRNIAKQLGINLASTFSIGSFNGSFNNGIAPAVAGGATGSFPLQGGQLDVTIRALEERGALRTLAEPVLTALSGQPASFLAGGELPYTLVDGNGNPTTVFKPYGVQLDFTPTIKANGAITLVVKSSVSEPSDGGALNRRDVSTTVELGVGQTLSIAGMLSERNRQDIDRLPGLGDIPILGALFRSREYRSERTELVFLVTPYYARAKNEMPVLPTDNITLAGDAEAVFLGHIESIYGVGPGGMRGSYNGSVGFLLD